MRELSARAVTAHSGTVLMQPHVRAHDYGDGDDVLLAISDHVEDCKRYRL